MLRVQTWKYFPHAVPSSTLCYITWIGDAEGADLEVFSARRP